MLISVFDLWILIDRCNLCVLSSLQAPAGTMYNSVKIIQIQEVSVPSLLKENPTTTCMSWSRCCFKKNHVSYVLQINTNIKFTIKYTLFSTQHVLITRWERVQLDALRKQTETNITTHNCCPSWTSRLLRWHYKLPRLECCIHRDFPRITIGVHDGRAEMA